MSRPIRPRKRLEALCIGPQRSMREALETIGRGRVGIALVTDGARRLLGTITDGDVRRAVLAGARLEDPVDRLLDGRGQSAYPEPVTAHAGTPVPELLSCMKRMRVRHLPLLDDHGSVVELVTREELCAEPELRAQALIVAGGYGRRLRPLTDRTPKPMLPIGERPLLERTVLALRDAGIRRITISTHYLADQIEAHFGDGATLGVELGYVREPDPLGTAGALRQLEHRDESIVVVNGDIVTAVDYRALAAYHEEHQAMATVATRRYALEIPYGVIHARGAAVTAIVEKPALDVFVNAGIYVLDPLALEALPPESRFDMPELIARLLARRAAVVSFPVVEPWVDIGQPLDYERARDEFEGTG